MNVVPKLHRYVPQCLAPVYVRILHKSVEDILASLGKCLKRAVFMIMPCILLAETGGKVSKFETLPSEDTLQSLVIATNAYIVHTQR